MMRQLIRDLCQVAGKHAKFSNLVLILLLAAVLLAQMVLGIGCPIHFITGINCPGCGMSRALFRVLQLDFAGAFLFHPLWWVLLVWAVFWFLRESARISPRTYNSFFWCFAIMFLAVYLFRLLDPANSLIRAAPHEGLVLRLITGVMKR